MRSMPITSPASRYVRQEGSGAGFRVFLGLGFRGLRFKVWGLGWAWDSDSGLAESSSCMEALVSFCLLACLPFDLLTLIGKLFLETRIPNP